MEINRFKSTLKDKERIEVLAHHAYQCKICPIALPKAIALPNALLLAQFYIGKHDLPTPL